MNNHTKYCLANARISEALNLLKDTKPDKICDEDDRNELILRLNLIKTTIQGIIDAEVV